MALSLLEKRAIQKTIAENMASIASGTLGLMDKRKAQTLIVDGLKKLGEAVATPEPEQTLFQQVTKGVHDALGAIGVFNKIKEEVDRLTRETIGSDSALNEALRSACIKCADLAESEGLV